MMNPYLGMKVAQAEVQLRLERAENRRIAISAENHKNRNANMFRNLAEKFKQVKAKPAY